MSTPSDFDNFLYSKIKHLDNNIKHILKLIQEPSSNDNLPAYIVKNENDKKVIRDMILKNLDDIKLVNALVISTKDELSSKIDSNANRILSITTKLQKVFEALQIIDQKLDSHESTIEQNTDNINTLTETLSDLTDKLDNLPQVDQEWVTLMKEAGYTVEALKKIKEELKYTNELIHLQRNVLSKLPEQWMPSFEDVALTVMGDVHNHFAELLDIPGIIYNTGFTYGSILVENDTKHINICGKMFDVSLDADKVRTYTSGDITFKVEPFIFNDFKYAWKFILYALDANHFIWYGVPFVTDNGLDIGVYNTDHHGTPIFDEPNLIANFYNPTYLMPNAVPKFFFQQASIAIRDVIGALTSYVDSRNHATTSLTSNALWGPLAMAKIGSLELRVPTAVTTTVRVSQQTANIELPKIEINFETQDAMFEFLVTHNYLLPSFSETTALNIRPAPVVFDFQGIGTDKRNIAEAMYLYMLDGEKFTINGNTLTFTGKNVSRVENFATLTSIMPSGPNKVDTVALSIFSEQISPPSAFSRNFKVGDIVENDMRVLPGSPLTRSLDTKKMAWEMDPPPFMVVHCSKSNYATAKPKMTLEVAVTVKLRITIVIERPNLDAGTSIELNRPIFISYNPANTSVISARKFEYGTYRNLQGYVFQQEVEVSMLNVMPLYPKWEQKPFYVQFGGSDMSSLKDLKPIVKSMRAHQVHDQKGTSVYPTYCVLHLRTLWSCYSTSLNFDADTGNMAVLYGNAEKQLYMRQEGSTPICSGYSTKNQRRGCWDAGTTMHCYPVAISVKTAMIGDIDGVDMLQPLPSVGNIAQTYTSNINDKESSIWSRVNTGYWTRNCGHVMVEKWDWIQKHELVHPGTAGSKMIAVLIYASTAQINEVVFPLDASAPTSIFDYSRYIGDIAMLKDRLNLFADWMVKTEVRLKMVELVIEELQSKTNGIDSYGDIIASVGEMIGSFLPIIGTCVALTGALFKGIAQVVQGDLSEGLASILMTLVVTGYTSHKMRKRLYHRTSNKNKSPDFEITNISPESVGTFRTITGSRTSSWSGSFRSYASASTSTSSLRSGDVSSTTNTLSRADGIEFRLRSFASIPNNSLMNPSQSGLYWDIENSLDYTHPTKIANRATTWKRTLTRAMLYTADAGTLRYITPTEAGFHLADNQFYDILTLRQYISYINCTITNALIPINEVHALAKVIVEVPSTGTSAQIRRRIETYRYPTRSMRSVEEMIDDIDLLEKFKYIIRSSAKITDTFVFYPDIED